MCLRQPFFIAMPVILIYLKGKALAKKKKKGKASAFNTIL